MLAKKRRKSVRTNKKLFINEPPHTIEKQNELADEFLVWVDATTTIVLEEFPLSKQIAPTAFYQMADHNPYVDQVFDYARYRVAERLINGWHEKTYRKEIINKLLPLYHKRYHEFCIAKHVAVEKERESGFKVIEKPVYIAGPSQTIQA